MYGRDAEVHMPAVWVIALLTLSLTAGGLVSLGAVAVFKLLDAISSQTDKVR
jgi:hypothetical protein